jgi:hypothetical protein
VQRAREGIDRDGNAHDLATVCRRPGRLKDRHGESNRVGRRVAEHEERDAEDAGCQVLGELEEVVELCERQSSPSSQISAALT